MNPDLLLVAISLVTWGIGEGMFLYFEPLYLQELGADPLMIGSIMGAIGIVMAISYLPAGYLSDRFGRRPLLRIAWMIGLIATTVMGWSSSLPLFVLGMSIYSFTTFVTVPLNSYVTHARGRLSVARAITLISAFYNVGVIAGPLIGGWIGDRFGLQRTFQVAAVFFVVSTIVIFQIKAQPVEKHEIQNTFTLIRRLMTPAFMRYMALVFFIMFGLYLSMPLSQNYLQNQQGLNLSQIGKLVSARSIGLVILSMSLGQLSPSIGLILSQVGMALFSLLMWQSTGMPGFTMAYFLLGSYVTARNFAIAHGRSLLHSASMGIGYGLIETAAASATILAAPVAGLLYKQQPVSVYYTALLIILVSLSVSTLYFYQSSIRKRLKWAPDKEM